MSSAFVRRNVRRNSVTCNSNVKREIAVSVCLQQRSVCTISTPRIGSVYFLLRFLVFCDADLHLLSDTSLCMRVIERNEIEIRLGDGAR